MVRGGWKNSLTFLKFSSSFLRNTFAVLWSTVLKISSKAATALFASTLSSLYQNNVIIRKLVLNLRFDFEEEAEEELEHFDLVAVRIGLTDTLCRQRLQKLNFLTLGVHGGFLDDLLDEEVNLIVANLGADLVEGFVKV